MFHCYKCGATWESERFQPAFREQCPECEADAHCCRNCRFHDPGAHNQCTVSTTEWVPDREKANLCEDFEMAAPANRNADDEKQAEARQELDRLFGGDDPDKEKPRDFQDLFGD